MSRTPSSPKVLIAAGGTGGHIYPALAMADAFRRLCPGVKVEFVGTPHGLENKIIPPKGYKIHLLPVGRLNSNVPLWERLRTLTVLPWSFIKSARLLRRERPDFVLGVGGYVSGPVLLMASLLGFRSAIWEPNAMPGMANRILARFVDECWVVFEEARAFLKSRRLHTAGMPVRQEIEDVPALTAGAAPATTAPGAAPAPDRGGFHILVFGGSQGARGINNTVLAMVKEGGEGLRGCRIVHQTGAADFERIREGYAEIPRRAGSDGDLALPPVEVDVREYLHDMGNQYAQADLVICRAGTGTLSELAACGKAAILIPFPFASDDHQRKNAENLRDKGAAVLILQKDLTPESLRRSIVDLREHPEKRKQMSERIRNFHHPRAAEVLVAEFLERINPDATC